ncbi:xanthine dehydrogenase family protein subunit M [Brevibacillus brevis]|uniref:Xanthine dehydrogenase family protein subunit M n=1 Tax=Brevibacillus brevis TaxID=1393 RepID=A0ABY9T5K8_BREBE|nr:xanthine dehydrogenase family protein subunit M [Brevibacillus brevis]WNC15184.1 xanthine dehydrogenase family protein subunit M [Brevibacillus brevis]
MKPAAFEYLRPSSLQEALQFLSERGEDAKIISGGQSLIPVLNMRLSTPKYLIDIGRVEDLSYIREEDGYLVIGALTRHRDVECSPLVKERCPLLAEAVRWIGHPQIRQRGTIGGSIAHADPSAELPCVIAALRGEIVIAHADGEETVSPDEFFLTYLLTSLQPDQMVKELRFPIMPETSGYEFTELSRRHGDFALVEIAAVVDLDEAGEISLARLAAGGANPVPCVLTDAEEFLIGKRPDEEVLEEASVLASEQVEPDGDLHGSVEYRRSLVKTLTKRALQTAIKRAGGAAR